MSYGTEADYRAALVDYLALHEAFYRFHKRVNTAPPAGIAECERDCRAMVQSLAPAVATSYRGPRIHVERLAETLKALEAAHASTPAASFDVRLTNQAYVDVDNMLQDLLRHREQYTAAFDDVMAGLDRTTTPVDPPGR